MSMIFWEQKKIITLSCGALITQKMANSEGITGAFYLNGPYKKLILRLPFNVEIRDVKRSRRRQCDSYYMGLCDGYLYKMIEGIKTYKPEVKASKLDKRLQSYGHSKFCMSSYSFPPAYEYCSRLLDAAQTPTRENFDIPGDVLIT